MITPPTRPLAGVHPLLHDALAEDQTMGNRFLLSAIAFQRAKQLQGGAAARVERGLHKPTYVAVLEVLANRISWSRTEVPAPVEEQP
jgi:DNA-directed RNA polymerase subunit K/omega